jgi:hypothetical protein
MNCLTNNNFVSVSGIGQNNLINQLEDNLKSYLDNGFLHIGGFVNINAPTSGIFNNGLHKAYPVKVPGYRDFQVWQTIKKDWVWESGITYNNISPITISGITVNNTGVPAPTGSGNMGYQINYPLGRITFNNPVVSGTNVQLNYSYRWCQVYKSSTSPWWRELQQSTLENNQIQKTDSGDFYIDAQHRVQMPCIIIEPIARSTMIPYQLGDHTFRIQQDILFHIFTENASHRNDILDILRLQKNKVIELYNIDKIRNVYGTNYAGAIVNSGLKYNELINKDQYKWFPCYFIDYNVIDMESANFNLSWCTLRVTSEIII